MSRFTATPPSKSKGSKPLTIKEFSNIRVQVPSSISYAGLVLMGRVNNDGKLEIGYVRAQDIPAFKPVDDLQKLGAAARIVSGIEAAEASIVKTAEIKSAIVANLVNTSGIPNIRVQASAELYKCKALTEALDQNLAAINEKVDPMKTFFTNMVTKAHIVIREYLIANQITSTSDAKLYDLCAVKGIPKYIFDKLTNRTTTSDIKQKDLMNLIFPNKVEKGIQVSKTELQSVEIQNVLKELEQDNFDFKDMKEMEKIFLIPIDFKNKIGNVLSLPTQRADSSKPVLDRVKFLQKLFYDFDPYDCTEINFKKHSEAFTMTVAREEPDPKDNTKKIVKYYTENITKPFSYLSTNIAPIKQQYTEYLQSELSANSIYTDSSHSIRVSPILYYKEIDPIISFYRTEVKATASAEDVEKIRAKVKFEPKDPPEFNYQYISPLSNEALRFIKGLVKGKANPSLVKNVQGFLTSFHSDALQDLAVRRMLAAAQQRIIVLKDDNQDDDENVEPITSFT